MNGKRKNHLKSWMISSPALILIGLIVVFPILYTAYISLTNMNTYHWFNYDIIGLKNYARAVTVFDSGFLEALGNTILWTAVNMVFQLVIAFVIANFLNVPGLRLRNVYKTILMFPWAMPGYVSILLWKTGMFNSQFGLLTQWMEQLSGQMIRWLQNDVSAFICCTVVNLWLALPFMIMIVDGEVSLGIGAFLNALPMVVTAIIGLVGIGAGFIGYLNGPMNPILRIVSLAGGLCLVIPGTLTDIIGIALIALVVVLTHLSAKKRAAVS